MKKCPNCEYLWADDYTGACVECGKPLGQVSANTDLNFRYAGQIQKGMRENDFERRAQASRGGARPGDAYDRADIPDGLFEAARKMLVQREEVEYEV